MENTKSKMEEELQFSEFNCGLEYLLTGRGSIIARGFERCLRDLGHDYKVSFRNENDDKENARAAFKIEKPLETYENELDNDEAGHTTLLKASTGSFDIEESHVSGEVIAINFERILKKLGVNMTIDFEHYNVGKLKPTWSFNFTLKE